MSTSARLEFTGSIHEALARGESPPSFQVLGASDSELQSFSQSLRQEAREATLLQILGGESGFSTCFLELTGRCNEECSHCYASAGPSVQDELSADLLDGLLPELKALGFRRVQFTGGDPLIAKTLKQAVSLASRLAFEKIEVYTNCLALGDDEIQLFSEHEVEVATSLFSHDAKIHDQVTRTPGSHQRTVRAIRRLLEKGLRLRVGGVQGCADGQDQEKLMSFLQGLGVSRSSIHVDRQRPVGRGAWTEDTVLLPPEHSSELGIHGAKKGGAKLCVTYSGQLVPCIFDRRTVLGDLKESGLSEILSQKVALSRPQPQSLPQIGQPLACQDCQTRADYLANLTWRAGR